MGHHFDHVPDERPILLEPWTEECEEAKRKAEGERVAIEMQAKEKSEEAERLGKRLPSGSVPPLRPAGTDRSGMLEWARLNSGLDRLSLYIPRRRDVFTDLKNIC